jgi:N6-adenosine-specific RNA methylase IME4
MTYATIVADPPWQQKAGPLTGEFGEGFDVDGHRSSQEHAYPTLPLAEIAALPVRPLAAPDAHLYLWVTNKFLFDAREVARAWGFTYSTTLVWAKKPMGGGLGGTYGISTEFVLFCRRGSLRSLQRQRGTWFQWKRPYDERGKPKSSAKPPEFMDMVEATSPGPYIELFARSRRPGWDAWGNEVVSSVEIAA